MTHFRTALYADTKAMLQAECAADIDGREGLLYGLIASENIYVELHGVTITKASEATTRLPLINLSSARARRERAEKTSNLRGSMSLDVEVLVTGDDGETAAATRDALVERVERALLFSDVEVSGQRWSARPWTLTDIEDQARMVDGAVLMSSAVLSLSIDIEVVHDPLPEAEFTGLDITMQTRDPDDETTEVEVTIDLDEDEEEEP
jgi:hypothetical protein